MVGAPIRQQTLRMSPDAAFSLDDRTACVILITVIGGIGTIVFSLLHETLSHPGTIHLMIFGTVAIIIMLKAPRGIRGVVADRLGIALFPVRRRLRFAKTAPNTAAETDKD